MLGNPLINDYVHKNNRGAVTLINNLGYIAGEIFAMAVFFNFTKHLQPSVAFLIVSLCLFTLGVAVTIVVKEHRSSKKHLVDRVLESSVDPEHEGGPLAEVSGENSSTKIERFKQLTQRSWQIVCNDPSYVVAFFGSF